MTATILVTAISAIVHIISGGVTGTFVLWQLDKRHHKKEANTVNNNWADDDDDFPDGDFESVSYTSTPRRDIEINGFDIHGKPKTVFYRLGADPVMIPDLFSGASMSYMEMKVSPAFNDVTVNEDDDTKATS